MWKIVVGTILISTVESNTVASIYLPAPLNSSLSSTPTMTASAQRSRIVLLSIYVAVTALNLLMLLQSATTCYICMIMEEKEYIIT